MRAQRGFRTREEGDVENEACTIKGTSGKAMQMRCQEGKEREGANAPRWLRFLRGESKTPGEKRSRIVIIKGKEGRRGGAFDENLGEVYIFPKEGRRYYREKGRRCS